MNAKIMSLAPWFGSKRTLAPHVVHQLGKHAYYHEPCAGSMAVLFAKEPSEHEVVCDLHGALTNLAWVVQDQAGAHILYDQLQRVLYNDELYKASKDWLERFEKNGDISNDLRSGLQLIRGDFGTAILDWAYHYFVASWMGRNGVAGTARVNYQIATRWTKGGGSGPGRVRAAVDSIPEWHQRLKNVHVLRRSCFDVLPKLEDDDELAIYADPPYLLSTRASRCGKTASYIHDFTLDDHKRLADELRRFQRARVVVSYYADPMLAKLYPGWTQLDCSRHKHLACQNKRGMGRKEAPEVLLINGDARPEMDSVGQLLFAE